MFIDERARAHLAATTRFGDVRFVEVTDSTNRVVADLAAAGAPEGVVVVAEFQTAGRGRLNRRWEAPPGTAVTASVLLRPGGLPSARWHLVTAAVALAARQACTQVAGFTPEVKWPNDLLVGERKLAGVLAEAMGGAVVVGLGWNVSAAPQGAVSAEDAAGHPVDRGALLTGWLEALDRRCGQWDDVAAEYRRVCATVGRQVRVERPGGSLRGTAVSIDSDGRLVVRPASGAAIAVSAGDVTHVRPAGADW